MDNAATLVMLFGSILGIAAIVYFYVTRNRKLSPPRIMSAGMRNKHPIPPNLPKQKLPAKKSSVLEGDVHHLPPVSDHFGSSESLPVPESNLDRSVREEIVTDSISALLDTTTEEGVSPDPDTHLSEFDRSPSTPSLTGFEKHTESEQPFVPSTDFDDNDEIEVLPTTEEPQGYASDLADEIAALRLALDESTLHATHLAAERDALQQAIDERDELLVSRGDMHQVMIDELRQHLGQQEGIAASYEREKEDLSQQLEDWKRKFDQLQAEYQTTLQAPPANSSPVNSSLVHPLAEQIESADAEGARGNEERWNDEREHWERALREAEQGRDRALGELSLLEETVRQLNHHVTHRDMRVTQLERERIERSSEEEKLRRTLDEERQRFADQLRAERSLSQQITARHVSLKSDLTQANLQLAETEAALRSSMQKVEEAGLNPDADARTTSLGAAQLTVEAAEQELLQVRSEFQTLQNTLKEVQDDLRTRDVQWREHVAHLHEQHGQTKRELQQALKDSDDSTAKIAALQESLHQSELALTSLRHDSDQLQNEWQVRLEQLQHQMAVTSLTEATSSDPSSGATVDDLQLIQNRLAHAESQRDALHAQLVEAERQVAEYAERDQGGEATQLQLDSVQRELRFALQQLDGTRQEIEERDRVWKNHSLELEEDLRAARDEVTSLQRQMAVLATTAEDQVASSAELVRYQQAHAALVSTLSEHQLAADEQLRRWEQEREETQRARASDEQIISELRVEIDLLRNAMETAERQHQDQTRELADLKEQLQLRDTTKSEVAADQANRIEELQANLSLLEAQIAQSKRELSTTQDLLGAAYEELDFRAQEIGRITRLLATSEQGWAASVQSPDPEMVREIESLKSQLNGVRSEAQRMQHELIELKQQLAWAEEDRESRIPNTSVRAQGSTAAETDQAMDRESELQKQSAATNAAWHSEMLQIEARQAETRHAMQQLNDELLQKQQMIGVLQRQVETVQQQLLQSLENGRHWQEQATQAEQALLSLEPENARHLKEITRLVTERDRTADAAASASRTIALLSAQNADLHEQIDALRQSANDHAIQAESFHSQIDSLQKKVDQLQLDLTRQRAEQVDALARQQEEQDLLHRANLARLEATEQQAREAYESEMRSEMERTLSETLAQALSVHQDKVQQFQEAQERELQSLREQLATVQTERLELAGLCEVADQRITERENQIESTRRRLQDAGAANEELTRQVKSLQAQLRTAISTEEIDELRTNYEELQQKLQIAEQDIERRESSLSAAKHRLIELQQLSDQRHETISALEESIASIPSTLKEAGQLRKEVKQLRSTTERQIKKLATQEQRLQDMAIELSKARGEVASLNSELSQQNAVIRALTRGKSPAHGSDSNGNPEVTTQATKRASKKGSAGASSTSKSSPFQSLPNDLGTVFEHPPERIDDLKLINGIGPALETRLHSIGIYQFAQIKSWSKQVAGHIDEQLALGGRISRENWVQQARKLDS